MHEHEHECYHMLFSLARAKLLPVQSRSLSGRHVSTSFLDLVLGALMKQVFRLSLKPLAAECLVGVCLGLLNFLIPCLLH